MPATSAAGGELYGLCLRMPGGDWFTLRRLAGRYALATALFYYHLFTAPAALALYTWRFWRLWHGACAAAWRAALLPLSPLLFLCAAALAAARAAAAAWRGGGPPRDAAGVWGVAPDGPAAAVAFDALREFGTYITVFTQLGCAHPEAVGYHRDEPLTKTFWRTEVFDPCGIVYPRAVGRWDGESVAWDYPLRDGMDLFMKLDSSFYGAGDRLFVQGTDFRAAADVERALCGEAAYRAKQGLVLEFARPRADIGTHSLDIITVRTAPGGVARYDVACVVLWASCAGPTSHSAKEGYVVDAETEVIVDTAHWYSAWFRGQAAPLIGARLGGVRAACRAAEAAHARAASRRPWLASVGWDCMLTPGGGVTFFEGNLAAFRLPRRILASRAHAVAFARAFATQHHLVACEESAEAAPPARGGDGGRGATVVGRRRAAPGGAPPSPAGTVPRAP